MADCPKCKKKIPIYHLGQFCPHCGVNVRFYDFDKNFYRDAKRAELSLAKTNIFIAHVKAALIGSKLAIIRLCVMLLPVLSLLVPYATAIIKAPFIDKSISLSGLGIYTAFTDGSLNFILSMLNSNFDGEAFKAFAFTAVGFVLIALVALIIFILTVLAFTNIKKMQKTLCVFSVIGTVFAVLTAILAYRFVDVAGANAGSIISGKMSFGFIVTIVMFAVNFVINYLIVSNGYNIVYKEGDLERAEIAKKVKAGEINIDDLSQPIVETEETRKIDEEIAQQQALYQNKEGGENDG